MERGSLVDTAVDNLEVFSLVVMTVSVVDNVAEDVSVVMETSDVVVTVIATIIWNDYLSQPPCLVLWLAKSGRSQSVNVPCPC